MDEKINGIMQKALEAVEGALGELYEMQKAVEGERRRVPELFVECQMRLRDARHVLTTSAKQYRVTKAQKSDPRPPHVYSGFRW